MKLFGLARNNEPPVVVAYRTGSAGNVSCAQVTNLSHQLRRKIDPRTLNLSVQMIDVEDKPACKEGLQSGRGHAVAQTLSRRSQARDSAANY